MLSSEIFRFRENRKKRLENEAKESHYFIKKIGDDVLLETKRNLVYVLGNGKLICIGKKVKSVNTDDEGQWVTLKNGVHVQIENGKVTKGPEALKNPRPALGKLVTNSKQFRDELVSAKKSHPPEVGWRVDTDGYSDEDYDGMKKYSTDGGSTYALHDKDIVSVCINKTDTATRGKDLIEEAVRNGGDRLDSYEGNHRFYIKNGFEPVSWCKWEDDYAPDDWLKANGITREQLKTIKDDELTVKREDIIFYKHTGKVGKESASEFKERVAASSDYDSALKARNDSIKAKKK